MQNLIRVQNIEEPVYLKKGWFGEYSVVHPTKKPDGSWNWFNVFTGGKDNLFRIFIYIVILLLLYYGVNEMMSSCVDMAENPCKYTNLNCQRVFNANIQITPGEDVPIPEEVGGGVLDAIQEITEG